MEQIQHEVVSNVKRLLTDKDVDVFIGYERGTLPLRTSPCFVKKPEDARRLTWSSCCSNNLTVYLPRMLQRDRKDTLKRIGIMCKGCDSRSLVELIKEKQITRDRVVIMGISCTGIVDNKKIIAELDGTPVSDWYETREEIVITTSAGERKFTKKDFLFESCYNCAHPTPAIYDILIRSGQFTPNVVIPDPRADQFSRKPREERWRYFETEVSRCIRCYACRNACPNCYCKECFAEQTKPQWFSVTTDVSDLLFFHMVRILHQTGRCVDCGACVRACPMDIDLRTFTRMLCDEVKERFSYEPGLSVDDHQPLATYSMEDAQEFMTEPE